jgi:hypothetical protein
MHKQEYFEWLCGIVGVEKDFGYVSFEKLVAYLHTIPFTYCIPRDSNRAEDGISLRYRFEYETGLYVDDDSPCSVFEMMVALAIKCEESMDEPTIGDRTGQWFWRMLSNLGLGFMSDDIFDSSYIDKVISRFLNREYEPDGRGGLFTIRNCEYDLRDVEIWYQFCWYLDNIM